MKTHPHHAEDCAAAEPDDPCEPAGGMWNQPPSQYVQEAKDQIDDTEAPYCRIRERALELMEKSEEL